MTLQRRVTKLEVTMGARPDPDADAAFAALVVRLDRLAERKATGDATAQPEIEALALAGSPKAAQAFALSVLNRKHDRGCDEH